MEWKKYVVVTAEETLTALRTTETGLDEAEAERRLLEYGHNTVQETEHFFWRALKKRSRSYISWIFVFAAATTFAFGNVIEAVCIIFFLFLNIILEIYQEFHFEKAGRVLQQYLTPKVQVRRNGALKQIASATLVPGDIIELRAGDTLPADVRFISSTGVAVQEILIHKNRYQVEKCTASLKKTPLQLTEAENIGFAGTSLVTGTALAVVIATAAHTALGDIVHESTLTEKETTFEKNIKNFSHFLVKLLLAGLVVVFGLYFFIHGEQVSMHEMLIFTLVLAIAVVPEALPALTTLVLARGSVSLTKRGLVVKRLSAIEDLGSIEILCVDKSGVLTDDNLTVSKVWGEQQAEVVHLSLLAARVAPRSLDQLEDSFDRALWLYGLHAGSTPLQDLLRVKRLQALDFDPVNRLQAALVELPTGEHTLIARGAPEEIFRRAEKMDAFTRKSLTDWIQAAATRGERVLGVATKKYTHPQSGLHLEGGFVFQGLISFLDPIKPGVAAAIREATALGVQVKVFSGDSPEIVGAVGYAVGLNQHTEPVMTGTYFESLSVPDQLYALETQSLFARFSPSQKKGAVQLLQKSHTVGVLGSGIIDAPILKLAHVAFVANDASDIAREASDIILLKKDIQSIVEGIQESRRVFANILKYLKITLAANFGNFYSITLAALFLPFLPLLPLQILLLNFLSDLPMLAIASDRVDQEKLERPKIQSIHAIVVTATLFGMISSFFDLTIFKIFSEYSISTVQTTWFIFSVLTELLLLYSLRSRRWFFRAEKPSGALVSLSLVALGLTLLLPFTHFTFLGDFLGLEQLSGSIMVVIIALAALYFVVTEIAKRWYYLHSALFTQTK